ncbi:MAG TPA: D-glycerate dehydrogenase [Methylomirabilota bacterium]|nr:D-glycerate dehydrogenase [Methylomirabilota bacterium]
MSARRHPGARMRGPRIFVTHPIADSAVRRLQERADVTWDRDASRILPRENLLRAVLHCDVLFCLLHDAIDAEVIAANPALKLIASMAIIPANIDVAAATARRLPVTVIPAVVTEATADLTWALLLAMARRVVEGDRLVQAGKFPGSQSAHLAGRYVWGKTLGLIGAGRIGQAVARRARGFDMRILYYDPRRLDRAEEAALAMRYAPMEQVLAEADVVSVHAAYTPETRHLIGAAQLERMKPTAYLINTSRGPVLDEKAVARALRERRIAGVGLDVYESEPRPDAGLLGLPNAVLTPHLGSAVDELRESMHHIVVDNIIAFLDCRQPPNCVNPEVFG